MAEQTSKAGAGGTPALPDAERSEEKTLAATLSGDLGIALDQVRAGVAGYDQTAQDALLWLHGYAVRVLRSRQRLCAELGYDWTVLLRVWSGTYGADLARVLEAVARLRRRAEAARGSEFIATEVTRRIWAACDLARDLGEIVHICGPTGRSKTTAVSQWQLANNHGRAIYVDLPVPCSLRTLTTALAVALGNKARTWRKQYEEQVLVERGLDRSNTLILDEATRLLPTGRGHDVRALEFVRRLHDAQGVGIVLVSTRLFRDEIAHGVLAAYLEQLGGRIAETVDIPDRVLRAETREVVEAFTTAPERELLAAVQAQANARDGGLRVTIRLLRQAKLLAERKGVALGAGEFAAAQALRANRHRWSE